ncbi:MAG TPA: hypothetical protein VM101_12185 [Flavitalea sp.]|nr:hypothetical protein [Flavitalea sp.]
MVEVFKTNVEESQGAHNIINILMEHFPGSRINFDLDDCDRILRVEGQDIIPHQVEGLLRQEGFTCDVLE